MIGPAEIEDMLSEYADAQPSPDDLMSTELQSWPPSHRSWGAGPIASVTEELLPVEDLGQTAAVLG
ncbi:hypothetical protein DK389_08540 [Methylobacterium durans]|uniref:Uncharacterized protein n=1 Tax=Methylobacterium durans TaxID=2202825 RepID=A0A2U8W4M6_9HYPH|nr:hypothetical protein DK389_08540 [Methylobacterium durans]